VRSCASSASVSATTPNAADANARRIEQGLRRLLAAIDAESRAASCDLRTLLDELVTYVQSGVMLSRKSESDGAAGAGAGAGAMDTEDAGPPGLDDAAEERTSNALWRMADALVDDDAVPAAAAAAAAGGADSAGAVAAAVAAAVAKALSRLPADHLDRLFPAGSLETLNHDVTETLRAIVRALNDEYAVRKETVGKRAGVAAQSFAYSKVRSIAHWSPYDPVRVVNADP
jgi:hypothetical protein